MSIEARPLGLSAGANIWATTSRRLWMTARRKSASSPPGWIFPVRRRGCCGQVCPRAGGSRKLRRRGHEAAFCAVAGKAKQDTFCS